MAVRVRYLIKVAISSTTAEEKDLGNVAYEIVTDSQGEGGSRKFTILAGAVDVEVPLGNISSAKFLFLRTVAKDPTMTVGELRYRRNTIIAEQTPLVPMGEQKEAHALLITNSLTGLFVSNVGTVDAELTVILAGD